VLNWCHVTDCSIGTNFFWIKDHSYQARRYAAAKWASTLIQELTEEKAKKVGFLRLFDYIRGANDRGIQKRQLEI